MAKSKLYAKRYIPNNRSAFTLTEVIVVVLMVSLFVVMTQIHLLGMLIRGRFKAQAEQFVSVMQMAARAAAESNRRYEVIIDIAEQCYMLRQITTVELSEVLDEEIIVEDDFGDSCRVVYVLFDDLIETDEDHQIAKFRVGHSGWQYGGKIVLIDENEQPYSIVVNRMNRIVKLERGDIEFSMPKRRDEMRF